MFRAKPSDGIAWITGASSGIGRALALHLADAGWRVVVTARRAEALDALSAERPQQLLPRAGDVTDLAAMRALVASVEADIGPIALAVLNAGVYDLGERNCIEADLHWRTIETNLGGTLRCLDPLLTAMLPRRRGQIAIVASLAGYGGIPGSVAYGSAKAAMITMAEALRLTHARHGINVQIVNPGFVKTAMTARNDYPMPFMMEPQQAARRIEAGLAQGGFEICFPRRLAWTMKAANLLPYPAWFALMARATRRARR